VIGGYHSGAINVNSDRDIDYDKDNLDLMIPLFIEEQEKAIFEYYESPRKFIPDNVLEFIEEYEFYKTFGGSLSFGECSSRFIEAKKIYESSLNHWSRPDSNNGGYS